MQANQAGEQANPAADGANPVLEAESQAAIYMRQAPQHCERCGRPLDRTKSKWLELNCDTGAWTDPDAETVPEDQSQGLFPFGAACARRELKASRRKPAVAKAMPAAPHVPTDEYAAARALYLRAWRILQRAISHGIDADLDAATLRVLALRSAAIDARRTSAKSAP